VYWKHEDARPLPTSRAQEGQLTMEYRESIQTDPFNFCPERGEFPHRGCELELREGSPGPPCARQDWGACHAHRTYWPLQVGGVPDMDMPHIAQLGDDYTCVR
jgi:hypothetical protein